MTAQKMSVVSTRRSLRTLYVLLALLVLATVAYWLFYVPALYLDDWPQGLVSIIKHHVPLVAPENRRPLIFTAFVLQYRLFGLNLDVYYLILWLTYLLLAYLVYQTIEQFRDYFHPLFSISIALLFLVYPTNYAHMWLTMLHVNLSFLLALGCIYLLTQYARRGGWPRVVAASICLLVSFGSYEGQAGLVAAWIVILFAVHRNLPGRRRLGLLVPVALLALFSLWRTVGYRAIGITDSYTSEISTDPAILLMRLVLGYKISLGWGWTATIEHLVPRVGGAKVAAAALATLVVVAWALVWTLSELLARAKRPDRATPPLGSRVRQLRPYGYAAAVGLILIGAGYLPAILLFMPNLSNVDSRINMFATLGASLFITSLLFAGATLLARERRQLTSLFVASLLPFLVIGTLTQIFVQHATRQAWQEQKAMWGELFQVAPNLKDDTLVLFIVSGYEGRMGFENWNRAPITAGWETSGAVQLLYNNLSLSADVLYPNLIYEPEPRLTPQGVITSWNGGQLPFHRTVAFTYDAASGHLHPLEALPADLVEGATAPVTLCGDCILPGPPSVSPFRGLVR